MSVNATPLLRFDDDSEEAAADLLLMDHDHPKDNHSYDSPRQRLQPRRRGGDDHSNGTIDPQQPYQQVYRLLLDGTAEEEEEVEENLALAGHNHHRRRYYSGIPTNNNNIVATTTTTFNTYNDDNHTIRFFPPLGAVANLCSATLGAGVLAIPYAMYQAGILAGGMMMIGAGLATYSSIDILSRCTSYYNQQHPPGHQQANWSTYESLVEGVLKLPYYRTMVELSLLLFCGGCAVAYLIAVGDILELVGFVGQGRRSWSMMVLWLVVMMPLSMLRHMNSIAGASAIGVSAIGTLVFATAIHVLITPHPTLAIYAPTTTTTANPLGWAKFLVPAHGWISILTACPVVLFAFSCQANVCAIYDELPMPNNRTTSPPTSTNTTDTTTTTTHSTPSVNRQIQQEQQQLKLMMMDRVAISSVAICAILYTSISLFVVADFGSAVLPNLLLNYHHHRITNGQEEQQQEQDKPDSIMQVATAAMAVAVILAYPLNIFPARVTLIGLLEKRKLPCDNGNRVDATAADHDDDTVRGGTRGVLRTNVPNDNLTQALLQDQMEQEQMETATAAATIYVNETTNGIVVNQSINGVGESVVVQSTSETLVPAASTTNAEDTTESPIIRFNLQQHVVITLFLTGTSLALALLIPDIKVMFGLVGGTASSMIGFCIPGLLGLQLAHDVHQDTGQTQWSTWIISWLLLIGGAVVGAITTVATIYDLVRHYY